VAELLPPVAVTPVGAPGTTASGVTDEEGAEGDPGPLAFIALTVNVYGVPLVRPWTVHEVVEVLQVRPPGDEVAVYPVMGLPPSDPGAVQDTVAVALPAVADTPVGASGTVDGVTGADAVEGELLPLMLFATTWKVYGVPLVRPSTVQVVAGATAVQPALVGVDVTV